MKPKINRRYLKVFLLACLVAFVGSCVVEDSFIENNSTIDQNLVREAEEWYTTNILTSNNARISTLIKDNPIWNKSKSGVYNGFQYIEIPIGLRIQEIFAQRSETFENKSSDYRLILFKTETGRFKPYIFKVEANESEFKPSWRNPNELSLVKIPESFSGKFSFFELTGKFVGSYKIDNGEIQRAISFKNSKNSEKKASENGRISTWEYSCTVTTYTTYVKAGDGDPEIVEQYEVWDCKYTYVPDQIAPTSPTGPDSGGSDPGCYEPHPQFHGFLVPCDDVAPCNNFEDLVDQVLNSEGGYVNDPVDRGGATNRGISWSTWKKAAELILGRAPTLDNLKNISANDARKIYKALYWDSINLSDINDGDLRGLVFDFHVLSGPNAMKVLQKTLNELGANLLVDGIIGNNTIGFINDYNDIIELYNSYKQNRINFLENLVEKDIERHLKKNPNATQNELIDQTQLKYKNGWLNRVQKFKEKTNENFENVNC